MLCTGCTAVMRYCTLPMSLASTQVCGALVSPGYTKLTSATAAVSPARNSRSRLVQTGWGRGGCGTGTGSMVSVLTKKGLVSGKNVRVKMTGGELIIDVDRDGDKIHNIYLTGPTNIVAKGEVTDEDLVLE